MLITSITGPSMEDAVGQIKASRRYADMIELRLDLIRNPDIIGLMSVAQKPVVVACTTKKEGGQYTGSERDRVLLLELASAFGAAYLDIGVSDEQALLRRFLGARKGAQVLLSCHLSKPPDDVSLLYRKMKQSGASTVKLAYQAVDSHEISHAVRYLSLALKDKQPAIAIAMGDAGEASRALYRVFGGWGMYAAAEIGPPAGPGQIKASVLRKLYRSDVLGKQTRVFGVIGNPLGQSKGVHLHNPLFRSAGTNAVYCRFPVVNLPAFMVQMSPLLSGFSVTIPHKQNIIKFLKSIDTGAEAIGAVNTVLRRSEGLWGTNTDGAGALDAIERHVKVAGKVMLVVGAGGAARAVAYEAAQRGARVVVANRTEERARKLGRDIGAEAIPMRDIRKVACDIVVNATSVGMTPHEKESPVARALLKGKAVFDVVYNPATTRLLRETAEEGGTPISGMEMYLNQAAKQAEFYSGKKPTSTRMRKLLMI